MHGNGSLICVPRFVLPSIPSYNSIQMATEMVASRRQNGENSKVHQDGHEHG